MAATHVRARTPARRGVRNASSTVALTSSRWSLQVPGLRQVVVAARASRQPCGAWGSGSRDNGLLSSGAIAPAPSLGDLPTTPWRMASRPRRSRARGVSSSQRRASTSRTLHPAEAPTIRALPGSILSPPHNPRILTHILEATEATTLHSRPRPPATTTGETPCPRRTCRPRRELLIFLNGSVWWRPSGLLAISVPSSPRVWSPNFSPSQAPRSSPIAGGGLCAVAVRYRAIAGTLASSPVVIMATTTATSRLTSLLY